MVLDTGLRLDAFYPNRTWCCPGRGSLFRAGENQLASFRSDTPISDRDVFCLVRPLLPDATLNQMFRHSSTFRETIPSWATRTWEAVGPFPTSGVRIGQQCPPFGFSLLQADNGSGSDSPWPARGRNSSSCTRTDELCTVRGPRSPSSAAGALSVGQSRYTYSIAKEVRSG
jgi:hypothetical protein